MLFITSSLQNHKKKPHKKEKRQVSAHCFYRQPGEGNSNRVKLGPEQGTKQPIPPTFIKN